MKRNKQAVHTHTYIFMCIYLQIIGWFYLLKCIRAFVPARHISTIFFFLEMGKCPPGISGTSAKSTLPGISCSNTFFIDLYQRLCLQSECGRARYKIAWHIIHLVCQRWQLLPPARQNKQVVARWRHLSCALYYNSAASPALSHLFSDQTGAVCRCWPRRGNTTVTLFLRSCNSCKGLNTLDPIGVNTEHDIDFQLQAKGGVDKQVRRRLNNTY